VVDENNTNYSNTQVTCYKKNFALCQEEIVFALVVAKEILREQDQRRIASKIVDIVNKELQTCAWLESKKLILERALSSTTLVASMPNSFLPPKVVITT